jgi:hypothetical protein
MPTVDATTFQRDFARYRSEAQREPVTITSAGRVIGGFLSSEDLAHYEHLKRREQSCAAAADTIDRTEYLKPHA